MADPDEAYGFSHDAPKTDPRNEDRLGYAPFAARLAKVIQGLSAPDGYVIGLHGTWGSGKSTALNFIQAYLAEPDEGVADPVQVVEFQPWIVSGHNDLVGAFFKVLSEALADASHVRAKLRQRVGRVARFGADPLIEAAATVGAVVDQTGGLLSRTGAAVAKKSVGAAIDSWLAEPSLQAAYSDLRARLRERGRKLLVMIDDIDRLNPDEVRTMMQMVKTVGRLPNVVYLLSYDQTVVAAALGDAENGRVGPRFHEKIVQHEIELPRPSRTALFAMLDEEISFLTGPTPDSSRWSDIIAFGLRRWINNPRDVVRLANAVRFSWSALKDEIDAQDLLAMEGLRLFDPDALRWVRRNRDLLLSEGRYQLLPDEQKEATVEALRSGFSPEVRADVLELLSTLFPQHGKLIRGRDRFAGSEPYDETARRRGVGTEAGYDAYFALSPTADIVSKADVDTAVRHTEDGELQARLLRKYLDSQTAGGEVLIGEYLEELRYRFRGRDPATPSQELLNALFEVGEEVLDIRMDWVVLSPRSQLSFLVAEMLGVWGRAQAGVALLAAFSRASSPAFCAEVFVARARELGLVPREGAREAELITEADLRALGPRMLELITERAASGELGNAPIYFVSSALGRS